MQNKLTSAPDGQGLKLKLPVPDGTLEGVPTYVGDLFVIPTTPRATPELRRTVGVPQGLRDGEASCFIPGVGTLLRVGAGTPLGALFEGATPGQKVYRTAAGVLDDVGTEREFLGWVIPLPEPARGLGIGVRGN
ncbi:hypothetical protein D3875_04035 [Deinococcus cavernae]|uniref:Uncharacterized protein n=1 Tax=Deinococcus cavernae TaxID=2320857 RepID=A0A418VEC0_9DEIO|nr:hypothetical protein [Deinococcus cavernae]RJF74456.1 hypothetical protein D3875_04035 [Deinococcus cavernae]